MKKNLVIVESPVKAKTITKFLGRNYKVLASLGHVRDLPKSKLGIDIDNDFNPNYITIRGKGPVLKELKSEAKKADNVYLATDPDREGEAISWHLSYALGLDQNTENRIEFNEITKQAIKNAIKKPRMINMNLVDAQQARRTLDRLVGYKISPLLWRKVRKGLSAGRVQSVTTKLICDREKEIEAFIPQEYWTIDSLLSKNNEDFKASFHGIEANGKIKKIDIKSKEQLEEIVANIKDNQFVVGEVKKGTKKRNPYPPYTTSSLQQDASKRLGFSTKKAMMVAQRLYEGVDVKGEGTVGLITYMRTDSVRISKEAIDSSNDFIKKEYGEKYSTGGREFKINKKRNVQDAHEAIRPTSVYKTPESIRSSLNNAQYKLYKLIWERFVASQMKPAIYDTLSVKINCKSYVFRASGSKISFDGFLRIYKISNDDQNINIPKLSEGEKIDLVKIEPQQHFTQPPARYTEASLVKTLEELGIGRPSTYSPTISTILSRKYVLLENKYFKPTELGIIVTELLEEYFADIVNKEFTAGMEEKLDKTEDGELYWKDIIRDFYNDFETVLKNAEEKIGKIEIEEEVTDEKCEKCGRNMVIKHGRYGKFLACPGYPECKNTKPLVEKVGVICPLCGGDIIERRSKKGRKFYGCSNYPKCNFMSWNKPIEDKCPKCNGVLVKKENKNGVTILCLNKECGYKREESSPNIASK